jgi:succinate---hydroxymethylglutarate CoA-transferase
VNRNKKSLGLSFASPLGVEALHKLALSSDILVENYLPGTLKKYQMDYDTINSLNPRCVLFPLIFSLPLSYSPVTDSPFSLIYASITGYGQTGPYSSRAGYDVMVEAEMGLMHITGERTGPPVKVGVAVTDLTTGLYTSNAIMASLIARSRTGKGEHLDVALSDCQVATLANMASSVLISGERDGGRWGTAHPSIVPYKGFRTLDGDILIGGGNDRLFGILCDKLGQPAWKTDERFITNNARVANRAELEHLIEDITKTKSTKDWLATFEGCGMPYAAINDVMDTLNHAHVQARGMVTEIEHAECGSLKLVSPPIKYSDSTTSIRSAPPTLGQHNEEVLMDILGLSEMEVAELRERGVIV